ncbi:C-factor [Phytophthora citrophthora]|uniref:C-factor n=1 Tax=Phytophthora citrophthora TaxID=4793 RepID=A0AAD9GQQ2_9STRA|nr:C-factor [Phytophthora citrophthora]
MLTLDVQDESTVLAAAKQLKDIPIDLLTNNAGIFTEGNTMTSTSKENMMKEFEVHAMGPLLVTRALLPNLRLAATSKRNCVHVVQMSTIDASIEGCGGPIAYCTSKTALHMVNSTMANELECDNIAVILLDPGMIYRLVLTKGKQPKSSLKWQM